MLCQYLLTGAKEKKSVVHVPYKRILKTGFLKFYCNLPSNCKWPIELLEYWCFCIAFFLLSEIEVCTSPWVQILHHANLNNGTFVSFPCVTCPCIILFYIDRSVVFFVSFTCLLNKHICPLELVCILCVCVHIHSRSIEQSFCGWDKQFTNRIMMLLASLFFRFFF